MHVMTVIEHLLEVTNSRPTKSITLIEPHKRVLCVFNAASSLIRQQQENAMKTQFTLISGTIFAKCAAKNSTHLKLWSDIVTHIVMKNRLPVQNAEQGFGKSIN